MNADRLQQIKDRYPVKSVETYRPELGGRCVVNVRTVKHELLDYIDELLEERAQLIGERDRARNTAIRAGAFD